MRSDIRRWLPLGIVIVLLVLRLILLVRYPVDSDEPQHLHVIYGWFAGEIPYLDRFDNHTPLFAWLFQPLAALVGETPNIVLWARLAHLPVGLGVVALVYLLARSLYGNTTALWSAAACLALADWSLKILEFRPDVLWAGLYFAALWILASRNGTAKWKSFLVAGLLLGAALAASIKTSFLMVGLCMGWAAAWCLSPPMRAEFGIARILSCAVAGLAGFVIVPALFIAWFASKGALDAMWFSLIEVNQPESPGLRILWLFVGIPVAVGISWLWLRDRWIRAAVFLAAAFYALLLIGLSPSLKKQTFLPAYPVLIMTGIGAWLARRPDSALFPASVCVALATHQIIESQPWRDGMRTERELLAETLQATSPDDTVLDLKGETVFRKRPIYLAYVLATTRGIDSGRLQDPDPADLSRAGTAFVAGDGSGFSAAMRKFMKNHYVEAGNGQLRVAGTTLRPSWEDGRWVERIDVPVAGDYVIIKDQRVVGEEHFDSPGEKVFDFGDDRRFRLLYWKPAWDRGVRPRYEEIDELQREQHAD